MKIQCMWYIKYVINECFYLIVYLLSIIVQLILIDAYITSARCLHYHIQQHIQHILRVTHTHTTIQSQLFIKLHIYVYRSTFFALRPCNTGPFLLIYDIYPVFPPPPVSYRSLPPKIFI